MEVNSTRFPSGIAALADWLHGKGKHPRFLGPNPCPVAHSYQFCGRFFSLPAARRALLVLHWLRRRRQTGFLMRSCTRESCCQQDAK